MTATQETVLSYLTGMCIFGSNKATIRMAWIADDMGLSAASVRRAIVGLRKAGNIELEWSRACFHQFRVVRRLEVAA